MCARHNHALFNVTYVRDYVRTLHTCMHYKTVKVTSAGMLIHLILMALNYSPGSSAKTTPVALHVKWMGYVK